MNDRDKLLLLLKKSLLFGGLPRSEEEREREKLDNLELIVTDPSVSCT